MDLYSVVIIKARYGGIYEGAQWLAFNDEPEHLTDVLGDDAECGAFFEGGYHGLIGRGATPQEAHDKLCGSTGIWARSSTSTLMPTSSTTTPKVTTASAV
jgi:hypothetical protein